MRSFYACCLMLFILGVFANAQAPLATQAKNNILQHQSHKDSSTVALRKFDENSITKYRTQRAFTYEEAAPEGTSLWTRFWTWFWRTIDRLFSGKVVGSLLNYVLTGVVIVLVVFIAIKLTGLDYKLFARKSKPVHIPFEESLENIHEINFDDQIEKALVSSSYRLAVRLLYLKTLKILSDQEQIVWKVGKTNKAYILELSEENLRQEFAALTHQFEYIWYGDFFIDRSSFERIHHSFNQFNTKKG